MRFIGNHSNNNYFLNIIEELKTVQVDEVFCAVAYADNKMDIFDICYNKNIKITFYGRYDSSVPVASTVLESFLKRKSSKYICRLIRDFFHPKVYWFKGYGAYIGSANISERGWTKNIEAGVFFEEEDLSRTRMDQELEEFFAYLDKIATPLTEEIYKEIKDQEKNQEKSPRSIKDGVISLGSFNPHVIKDPQTQKKDKFLEEWNSTLEIIRYIEKEAVKDKYRPKWIPENTPKGVQVDQFLQAFYYHRIKKSYTKLIFP